MITLHTQAHYPAALSFETVSEAAKAMRGTKWTVAYIPTPVSGLKMYLLNPDNMVELHGPEEELCTLKQIVGIEW